jgi:hypothetical protein
MISVSTNKNCFLGKGLTQDSSDRSELVPLYDQPQGIGSIDTESNASESCGFNEKSVGHLNTFQPASCHKVFFFHPQGISFTSDPLSPEAPSECQVSTASSYMSKRDGHHDDGYKSMSVTSSTLSTSPEVQQTKSNKFSIT